MQTRNILNLLVSQTWILAVATAARTSDTELGRIAWVWDLASDEDAADGDLVLVVLVVLVIPVPVMVTLTATRRGRRKLAARRTTMTMMAR